MGRPSKYTKEFRREAVELSRASQRPRCQVAEDLGVADGTLAAWVRDLDARDAPGALKADERAELERLRREVIELRQPLSPHRAADPGGGGFRRCRRSPE